MTGALAQLLIVVGIIYFASTLLLSRRKAAIGGSGPAPDTVIFLVPALNEAAVIQPTVRNLLQAARKQDAVMVIDDGSDDETAALVEQIDDRRLVLISRRQPEARQGKGRALNHAYRCIRDQAVRAGVDPASVVLCIVDADGRVSSDAVGEVLRYFTDPAVGAVQLLVRIRNRLRWLARFQDFEFLVFSSITQTAREHLGSVGLGGNGQFTRLSALASLGDEPWSDCLTEDLDLGIRLAIQGWRNRFCAESQVDQQGLTSLRPLIRQRTRWAQGHFQCWRHLGGLARSDLPTVTVLDLTYYLMAPAAVLAYSLVFTASIAWFVYLLITEPDVWFTPLGAYFLLALYVIGFAPAMFLAFVYRARSEDFSFPKTVLLGHLLAMYNFVWYLAECRALVRILLRHRGWAKTARSSEERPSDVQAEGSIVADDVLPDHDRARPSPHDRPGPTPSGPRPSTSPHRRAPLTAPPLSHLPPTTAPAAPSCRRGCSASPAGSDRAPAQHGRCRCQSGSVRVTIGPPQPPPLLRPLSPAVHLQGRPERAITQPTISVSLIEPAATASA